MAAIVNQYNRTIYRVAPDGNCLFRALAHQAFGDQTHHTQMRKVLVMLISDNLRRYKFLYMGRNGFEEHVDMMSKDGIWGTQLEMQAAADCLGVPVYELMYCSATNSHKWITFKPCHVLITHDLIPQPHFPFTVDHIELLHNGYHYDSITCSNQHCKLQAPRLSGVEDQQIICI